MAETYSVRSTSDPLRQVSARIVRWSGGAHVEDDDELAAEDPLEIRAVSRDGGMPTRETVAVIMRTPGHDEELTAGFLYGEGFVRARSELATLSLGLDGDGLPSPNILDVESADGASLRQRMREAGYTRRFAVNASCGVCGKNTVAAACASLPRLPLDLDDFTLSPEVLYALPECLRVEQRVFHSTGGLHAAGLFDAGGTLLALREDVGRHNAVDKLVGRALLDGALPLHRHILLVSGRLSFEIVQKALAAGIRLIAAVSAPSSLAVDLAEAGGITLAAFLRDERVNVYTHPHRVAGPQTPRS